MQNPQDSVQQIHTLLPNLDAQLNVKLYIPENYGLILQEKNEYFIGFSTMGLNKLDESFIGKLESTKKTLLQVVKQDGFQSFEKDVKLLRSQMQQQFPKNFKVDFFRWGNYPVAEIHMTVGMDRVYFAYVGLNDPAGNALIFRLVYPSAKDFGNGNQPREEDLIFWQNFLKKTIPLT